MLEKIEQYFQYLSFHNVDEDYIKNVENIELKAKLSKTY